MGRTVRGASLSQIDSGRARNDIRAVTKTDAAYGTIRSAIESGEFLPGDRVSAQTLAESFGMSSTPIREAIRLLQSEGLIGISPHQGAVVASFARDELQEVYRLRAALEPIAAGLAAQRANNEQLAELRRIHHLLNEVAGANPGTHDAVALNAQWHKVLAQASGSRLLEEFVVRLWSALPVQSLWSSSRALQSISEHQAVMDALGRGDSKRSMTLMKRHLSNARAENSARARDRRPTRL